MATMQERRTALYSKLPPELADLCLAVCAYSELQELGLASNADKQLEIVRLMVVRVRRWEDRQLRLQEQAAKRVVEADKPKRRLRRKKVVPHLRLVE